jgi:uncharacterized repeat protein (TIGR03803 family)
LYANTLYGTASEHSGALGGAAGTIYKIRTDGKNFTVLHDFPALGYPALTNNDGAFPMGGLVRSGGTLYGTASQGGKGGSGTVFKINIDGTGFAVLHHFTAQQFEAGAINTDGAHPMARLAVSGKTLYGTAQRGGLNEGTVFKLNTDGSAFTTLHTFARLQGPGLTNWDGAFPETELVVSGKMIYGTAWAGGHGKGGTIFRLSTDGTGFSVLHSFVVHGGPGSYNNHGGDCNDGGAYPEAGLVLWGARLYGTAHTGGPAGNGTVFSLNIDGTDFRVLHNFTAHGNASPDILNNDGESPQGLFVSDNKVYGVASENGRKGWGTIFSVNTDGSDFTVVHSFGGPDGGSPRGALVLSHRALFGVPNFGGSRCGGTVFKVNTAGTDFAILHEFTKEPHPPGLVD